MGGGGFRLAAGAVLAGAVIASAAVAQPAKPAASPSDTESCLKTGERLSAWTEAQEKKDKKLIVPREFVRVSADLDDFCNDKEFEKARVAIDWMNNCIANYRKPYSLGFCQRNKAYSCFVRPDGDGCAKKQARE